jgi:Cys-rich protein (TIGR01571 family)
MNYQPNGTSQQLQPETSERQHQRFSWQPPQEDAPAYEEIHQQQPQQQTSQNALQQSHISTNVDSQNRHFSYAQTPVEHEAFIYMSTPSDPPLPRAVQSPVQQIQSPYTPIDPRPQSMFNPLATAAYPQQPPKSYATPSAFAQIEKPPVSPISPHDDPRAVPFSPVSPMPPPQVFTHPAQLTQPVYAAQPSQPPQAAQQAQPSADTNPRTSHARKMSNLSPINTNLNPQPIPPMPSMPLPSGQTSPLPHKTPITPLSTISTAKSTGRENRTSYAHSPYSPHGFNATQTNNMHAVFSPDAAHGPNGLDFALHQPGQIAHPNMDSESSKEWSTSLCACAPDPSTCFTGLICPCVLYGRTAYRLSQKSAKRDPTDMLGYSATNGHCGLMAVACGLWGLFPGLQRTRIRRAYKLRGGVVGDLLKGCCCCCCVAVQNEREVRGREEASQRWAGPASSEVYTRASGMVYKAQQ